MENTLIFENGSIETIFFEYEDIVQVSVEANGEDCFIDLKKGELKLLITSLQNIYNYIPD